MLRKRDFVLFVLIVLFLLIAIGFTLSGSSYTSSPNNREVIVSEKEVVIESAEVITHTLDREARAAELRKKIAAAGAELSAAPAYIKNETEEVSEVDEGGNGDVEVEAVTECSDTHIVDVTVPAGAAFVEREGARLLVTTREELVEKVIGSSTITETEVVEDIIVQLPARRLPLSGSTCAGEGIVGFAQDGSVIRNNETGLYGVFGGETLIGYALDGFPIYGVNDAATLDECGGVVEGGQYRYYLASDRSTILECYRGIPVSL